MDYLISFILGKADFLRAFANFISLVKAIVSIPFVSCAICSVILIKGIKECNARKVCIFKWFLIASLFLLPIFFIYEYTRKKDYMPTIDEIIFSIFFYLWMPYQIYVISSLELMYREPPLPVTQPPSIINLLLLHKIHQVRIINKTILFCKNRN